FHLQLGSRVSNIRCLFAIFLLLPYVCSVKKCIEIIRGQTEIRQLKPLNP
ncbi:hypothetical protein PHET_07953, partial [Paragonimus heterotremus]